MLFVGDHDRGEFCGRVGSLAVVPDRFQFADAIGEDTMFGRCGGNWSLSPKPLHRPIMFMPDKLLEPELGGIPDQGNCR